MQHLSHKTPRETQPRPAVEHGDPSEETGPYHAHHVLDRLHDLASAVEHAIEHVVEHEESPEVIEMRARFDDWDRALDHYLEDRNKRKRA